MSARTQHRRGGVIYALVFLLFLAAAGFAVFTLVFRAPEQGTDQPAVSAAAPAGLPASHFVRRERFYNILCAGVDDGNGGSDTILLVSVDAENGSIFGVSIPRDSKAVFGGKAHKINAAYNSGGMDLLAQVVSEQLGVPVDYTVLVDLQGFAALVDEIGGVDFDVPLDMNYDDPVQGLSIHISRGMQHLNGADALKVVRFRHNNDGTGYGSEDIGRMETQQKFLKAVAKKILTPATLASLGGLVKVFNTYVKTDLTAGNLAWLGKEAVTIGADNVSFATLPGSWKSPYIYTDPAAALELVNEYLNPYQEPRTAGDLNIPS